MAPDALSLTEVILLRFPPNRTKTSPSRFFEPQVPNWTEKRQILLVEQRCSSAPTNPRTTGIFQTYKSATVFISRQATFSTWHRDSSGFWHWEIFQHFYISPFWIEIFQKKCDIVWGKDLPAITYLQDFFNLLGKRHWFSWTRPDAMWVLLGDRKFNWKNYRLWNEFRFEITDKSSCLRFLFSPAHRSFITKDEFHITS